ncbi:hypothetical protein JTB14_015770 [Gonioctena quinquepunctata]|nr:hypothetical protein JTB14_015770 [Gonioctena quinquepunctata]
MKQIVGSKKAQDNYLIKSLSTLVPSVSKNSGNQLNEQISKTSNEIATGQLSNELLKIESERKCQDVINLAPNESNDWTEVRRNKYSNRRRIVGNNREDTVKGVPKHVDLHVYKVDKDTSIESFTSSVIQNFPESESLNSKHPDSYTSFKDRILEENLKNSMNPKLWPYVPAFPVF